MHQPRVLRAAQDRTCLFLVDEPRAMTLRQVYRRVAQGKTNVDRFVARLFARAARTITQPNVLRFVDVLGCLLKWEHRHILGNRIFVREDARKVDGRAMQFVAPAVFVVRIPQFAQALHIHATTVVFHHNR